MDTLFPLAAEAAERLKARGETIAVGESAGGGLVCAALVAQPGASAFFLGGTVVYTREAGRALRDRTTLDLAGLDPLTEPFAQALANGLRRQMGSIWATSEMGAAGPAPSPYGPAAGTGVVAVSGPVSRATIIETGSTDRIANMRAFGRATLTLLIDCIDKAGT